MPLSLCPNASSANRECSRHVACILQISCMYPNSPAESRQKEQGCFQLFCKAHRQTTPPAPAHQPLTPLSTPCLGFFNLLFLPPDRASDRSLSIGPNLFCASNFEPFQVSPCELKPSGLALAAKQAQPRCTSRVGAGHCCALDARQRTSHARPLVDIACRLGSFSDALMRFAPCKRCAIFFVVGRTPRTDGAGYSSEARLREGGAATSPGGTAIPYLPEQLQHACTPVRDGRGYPCPPIP